MEGRRRRTPHLFIKQVGDDEPLQLTSAPAGDSYPAWSPDGSRIASLRGTDTGSDVYIVPSLAGTERRIGSTLTAPNIGANATGLDWSPDGRFLAIVDQETPDDSLDTREIERVTKVELEGISMYYGLTVSPDGQWILMSFPVPPTGDLFLVENFR